MFLICSGCDWYNVCYCCPTWCVVTVFEMAAVVCVMCIIVPFCVVTVFEMAAVVCVMCIIVPWCGVVTIFDMLWLC